MDKAKELSKNPFKMKNKLEKETEVIQKIIDTTAKKVVATDLADVLNKEFEALLLKTKDPIQAWIRANALEALGYVDASLLFKTKAAELGYVVENAINENADNIFNGTLTFQVWTPLTDPEEVKAYVESIIMSGQADEKLFNKNLEVELHELEAPDVNPAGMSHKDESVVVEETIVPAVTEETPKCECGNNETCQCATSTTEQIETELSAYDKLMAKYPLSDVLQSQLATVLEDLPTDRETVLNAVAAITGDTVENVEAVINETHRQQFEYSPQEETKWKLFEDDAAVKKPDFNPTALSHMISDDAFLKFSMHNLATGDNDKDLEMIFNTYVKGDDDMMNKLKTYESYNSSLLERTIVRDNVSQTIISTLTDLKVEGITNDVIANISKSIKENIDTVKMNYALFTPEVKKELKETFGKLSLNDVVTKLKESKMTLAYSNKLSEEISKAFEISNSAAQYVINTFNAALPGINEVVYIGAEPATYLFAIKASIMTLNGLGLSLTK